MTAYDAVVVGAGIAGLACAERVAALGGRVLVLERESRVGGMLRSDELDGFVVDRGPQTIRGADAELFAELNALDLARTAAEGSDARFVLHAGRLVALPRTPLAFLRTPLLSPAGKARILVEPLIRRGSTPDESVDSFFRRRVGHEVAERMVDPFVSGVHAGDPAELSMARVFPGVFEGERTHGSLAAWGFARAFGGGPAAHQNDSHVRPEIFSFRGGLERWPAALAERRGGTYQRPRAWRRAGHRRMDHPLGRGIRGGSPRRPRRACRGGCGHAAHRGRPRPGYVGTGNVCAHRDREPRISAAGPA